MNIRNVTLEWSYPKLIDNILADDRIYEKGIYCIYRTFGKNKTLLYIGKTADCFYNRITSHYENWINNYRGKKYVCLGRIVSPQNYDDDLLEDIEGALIYEMQPLHNTVKRQSYNYTYECKIHNEGYKGFLPSLISMREQE